MADLHQSYTSDSPHIPSLQITHPYPRSGLADLHQNYTSDSPHTPSLQITHQYPRSGSADLCCSYTSDSPHTQSLQITHPYPKSGSADLHRSYTSACHLCTLFHPGRRHTCPTPGRPRPSSTWAGRSAPPTSHKSSGWDQCCHQLKGHHKPPSDTAPLNPALGCSTRDLALFKKKRGGGGKERVEGGRDRGGGTGGVHREGEREGEMEVDGGTKISEKCFFSKDAITLP